MLTWEEALYQKMLLEAGVADELTPVIDRMLAEEDPLSDAAVDLAFAEVDQERLLTVLNEYLSKADAAAIDMGAVYGRLKGYFRTVYERDREDIGGLVKLMQCIGTGSEYALENWRRLCECAEYYERSLDGTVSPEKFREELEGFLFGVDSIGSRKAQQTVPDSADIFARLKALLAGKAKNNGNGEKE